MGSYMLSMSPVDNCATAMVFLPLGPHADEKQWRAVGPIASLDLSFMYGVI